MSEIKDIPEFLRSFRILVDPQRYLILKLLNKLGNLRHGGIMKLIKEKDSALLSYHLKQLIKIKLIRLDDRNNYYLISEKGKIALRILAELMEKYISENENEICRINTTCRHEFIKVCSYCAEIEKEESLPEKSKEEIMML